MLMFLYWGCHSSSRNHGKTLIFNVFSKRWLSVLVLAAVVIVVVVVAVATAWLWLWLWLRLRLRLRWGVDVQVLILILNFISWCPTHLLRSRL